MKNLTKPQNFATFIVWWNMRQNQATPDIHYHMAAWLEKRYRKNDRHLLMQAFRSAGKSTMIGLYCAWRLYRDPDLRIVVLAADTPLAKKMVRNVKRIIERHPLTAHMRPSTPDQWAGDRFTVNRPSELRDPSMMARGITSNITGSRADLIICDDVEVPNTSDSADKRADLRERLAEIAFVLTPKGTQLYIGTPHTYHSIYAQAPRTDLGEERVFLHGFKRLTLPIADRKGDPLWHERYTRAMVEAIKVQSGPNKFASQMMLEPVNIADGRLNPDLLKVYDHPLFYAKELGTLFLGDIKLSGASAWWDPAFAAAGGDRSVCAVTYSDDEGNIYIHAVQYLSIARTSEDSEATQQCSQIAAIARDCFLPAITVENNGIGKLIPGLLKNEMARQNVPCAVQEFHNSRNKETRILEAFDAPLAAGRLFVNKAVFDTPFMTEMREWRPERDKGFDDGLDAVAGALAQTPLRLARTYGKRGHTWMARRTNPYHADTDYSV